MSDRRKKPSPPKPDMSDSGGRPRLRLEWVEAGSLTPNPSNWRRHPDGQMAALRGLINDADVGWAGALLYNERTQRLIDGHGRQKIVDPKTPVPVLIGSWSPEAEKKILLTLDPIAGMAVADIAQLEALLDDVKIEDAWFAGLRDKLDTILEDSQRALDEQDQATDIVEDVPPEPPDEARPVDFGQPSAIVWRQQQSGPRGPIARRRAHPSDQHGPAVQRPR